MQNTFIRKKNKELRPREYLYENEIEDLMKACLETKYALRNKALVLISFRRALRPSEALNLKWDDISFPNSRLTVNRLKNGLSGDHLIHDKEIRLLKQLKKERIKQGCNSPYVFVSHQNGRLTISAYEKLVEKLGKIAKIPFKVHPHMFRHSWGQKARIKKTDPFDMMAHFGHRDFKSTLFYFHRTGNSDLHLFAD